MRQVYENSCIDSGHWPELRSQLTFLSWHDMVVCWTFLHIMVQCGSLFYILWLSCVPRVCQKSSILTLSIVFLAIDQKTDVTLLISLLPLSLDSNKNSFQYPPLPSDETDFPVLEDEMHQNKISEMRALLPHDHKTIFKAAEMFHETELLIQQQTS